MEWLLGGLVVLLLWDGVKRDRAQRELWARQWNAPEAVARRAARRLEDAEIKELMERVLADVRRERSA